MSQPARILVVDDNEDNRYTLKRRLRREGYENLAIAANGRGGIGADRGQPIRPSAARCHDARNEWHRGARAAEDRCELRHVPVIMVSARRPSWTASCAASSSVPRITCQAVQRRAAAGRIGACLERKRLHDREAGYLAEFSFDIWGNTVNVAARLAAHGPSPGVHLSAQQRGSGCEDGSI